MHWSFIRKSNSRSSKVLPRKCPFFFFVTGLIGHSRLVYSNYLSQFCFYISHLVDWLILALPCQINQISDSSQPNNCIIAASLLQMPVSFSCICSLQDRRWHQQTFLSTNIWLDEEITASYKAVCHLLYEIQVCRNASASFSFHLDSNFDFID